MKRRGMIYISGALIDSFDDNLYALFARFVPVHIEYQSWKRQFRYIGYSPLFEEIKLNEEAPEYRIIFHTDDYDRTYITAEKL